MLNPKVGETLAQLSQFIDFSNAHPDAIGDNEQAVVADRIRHLSAAAVGGGAYGRGEIPPETEFSDEQWAKIQTAIENLPPVGQAFFASDESDNRLPQ